MHREANQPVFLHFDIQNSIFNVRYSTFAARPYLGMGNNPVSGVDPDGREWIDAWGNHIWHNGSFTKWATEDDKMFHRALIQSPTGQESHLTKK